MNAEQIKSIFAQIDVNGDGSLSFDEIAQGLPKAGIKTDISKFKASFDAVDVDRNGTLDQEEFVSFMAKIL
ncbi:calcium-dependent_protein [Hexamita inflata]|uniref:Calcium-dependent protein n=1 Tax=Hexamita inflata TaxID=28002 RepID=A0AA86N5T9_9EUKA|nr:calcium-dependent protein [Hexamita inflata]